MQEDIEHRSVALTVQASKLTGNVLKKAMEAALRKMRETRSAPPTAGRSSIKKLSVDGKSPDSIEVAGRIRSFERIARKHEVSYRITKQKGTKPPKWTVYFRGAQAGAVTNAFKEFTRLEQIRGARPSLLSQLDKMRERVAQMARDVVKKKERGGPEL